MGNNALTFAVWVTFKSAVTGVKAKFDTLEKVVDVFVVKLVNGELPPYDERESTHFVGPASLASVAGRGPPTEEFRLRGLSGEEFRRVLRASAKGIKEFSDILRGDFRRFDQALVERRAHIARLEEENQRQLSHEGRRSLARWFRRRRRNGLS